MVVKISKKLIINVIPAALILAGSIVLCFALRLVSTQELWEANGVLDGGFQVGGMMMSIPEQNDTLFWWGFTLFIGGSALEMFKVIYNTIQNEMMILREVSIELNEEGVSRNLKVKNITPVSKERSLSRK